MNIINFIKDIIETRKRNTRLINLVNELKQIELDEIQYLEKRKKKLLQDIAISHSIIITLKENKMVGAIPNAIRYLDKQIIELHSIYYAISIMPSNLKDN
jgi:hypothetical protein